MCRVQAFSDLSRGSFASGLGGKLAVNRLTSSGTRLLHSVVFIHATQEAAVHAYLCCHRHGHTCACWLGVSLHLFLPSHLNSKCPLAHQV